MGRLLHASTVAVDGKGVLICGASGAGKSGLALQLMAYGAELVADDQTEVALDGGQLRASCPSALRGMIEARGVGLLQAPCRNDVPISLCVDLDEVETERLPPYRKIDILGVNLPLVRAQQSAHFAAAILLMVRHGRLE